MRLSTLGANSTNFKSLKKIESINLCLNMQNNRDKT